MTEDEVAMAMGEPEKTTEGNSGRHDWIYTRSNGKLLIVTFDATSKVISTNIDRTNETTPAKKKKK
jgi:hypothetical protein